MHYVKSVLKILMPERFVQYLRKYLIERQFIVYRSNSLAKTFERTYSNNAWGISADPSQIFYSGSGSHDKSIVSPYVQAVSQFLSSLEEKPNVVDLGCGDFNVGAQLREFCHSYVACDVVDKLIEFNRHKYEALRVDFRVIDIVKDDLPEGDVVFLRQVLQHLSNEQVEIVLSKISKKYKYFVLTEHLPGVSEFEPNIDKPSGPDIRTGVKSGVVITHPPFDFQASREELICSVHENGGVIETRLYFLD